MCGPVTAADSAPERIEVIPASVQSFFKSHCTICHDADDPRGKVTLEMQTLDLGKKATADLLEQVHRVLSKGDMPPKKKPRPSPGETESLLGWLDEVLSQRTPHHAVALRRLTRTEYANTIKVSLGIPYRIPPGFPEDTRAHGFDNVAESLTLSPPLIEAYAEAASEIADQVFPPPQEPPPPSEKVRIPAAELSSADGYGPSSLLVDARMRLVFRNYSSTTSKFGAKASGRYRVRFQASAFKTEGDGPVRVKSGNQEFAITPGGVSEHEYTVTLHPGDGVGFQFVDGALERIDANFPYAGVRTDLIKWMMQRPRLLAAWLPLHEPVPEQTAGAIRLLPFKSASYEIRKKTVQKAFEDEFQKPELDVAAATPEAAGHLLDAMLTDKNPTSFGGIEMHFYVIPMVWKLYSEGPAVDIHSVEIEGPIEAVEHPSLGRGRGLQTSIFGIPASKMNTPDALNRGVRKMLGRVFRRDPTDAEAGRYCALIHNHEMKGHTREDGLHLALRSALVSPQFLYRAAAGERLSLFELASRLSYFLTLRPPDETLVQAARDGSLADSGIVRTHAQRLLETKLAEDFIENFVGQWLGTRLIPEIMPDASLGRFSPNHQKAFIKEPELLFAEILRDNRPVGDFIDPDFTHTHPSVGQQMYGLNMPTPSAKVPFGMTRVSLERGSRNGGILGMAGVMMATANGVDTQPVVRGKWVLENILGDPPPPPPESVPALTPDTRGTKTIRDLMRAHTGDESCAHCHEKIDPYGFVFERFDAIGQWRDFYPVAGKPKKDWPGVDARAQLPDGTSLEGPADLKKHILSDLRPFARCLAQKLFLYGTARVPNYAERKELESVADRNVAAGEGFRDLLLDLVGLEVFRIR